MRRPTHEYLGFSAGLDFETKIMVKHDAPELLTKGPVVAAVEAAGAGAFGRDRCLSAGRAPAGADPALPGGLAEFRQAVTIITKNRLVTRDIDLLAELAHHNAAGVFVSITSLDDELIGRLEPRTTRPRAG